MSELVVQVVEVSEVYQMANADSLDVVVVGGWQTVGPRDRYKPGDKVVYFPPDTLLPPEVSDQLGVTPYLKRGRVQKIRLRGEPSFGFVQPADASWEVGKDVADIYQATKWEPPVRAWSGRTTAGSQRFGLPEHPKFLRYTDIDNLRHFPYVFEDGEEVILEEKIHGWNVRLAVVERQRMAGSRKINRAKDDQYTGASFWQYYQSPGVYDFLADYGVRFDSVELFGEGYGSGVQDLSYGVEGTKGFAAFDIAIDGRFLNYDERNAIFGQYGIQSPPLIARMPYSIEQVRLMSEGPTRLMEASVAHMREGVVVRPPVERTHPKVGRLVMKFVSDTYLLRKTGTDYTEE